VDVTGWRATKRRQKERRAGLSLHASCSEPARRARVGDFSQGWPPESGHMQGKSALLHDNVCYRGSVGDAPCPAATTFATLRYPNRLARFCPRSSRLSRPHCSPEQSIAL